MDPLASLDTMKKSLKEIEAAPRAGTIWRHVESKNCYIIICCALRDEDLVPVIVYGSKHVLVFKDKQKQLVTYTRPLTEFMDGRFELVPNPGGVTWPATGSFLT